MGPWMLTLCQLTAFSLVTLPLSLMATVTGTFRRTHAVFYGIGRVWGRLALLLGGVRVVVSGLEHVDRGRSYVIVANHTSFYDVFALLAVLGLDISFVLKRELTRIPIWGWGLWRTPLVIVDRTSLHDALRGMRAAAERLRAGGCSLLFFPEGTRSLDGTLQPWKRGAFTLAVRAQVPVLPVTINGSHRVLPRGRWRIQPGRIDVVVSPPVDGAGLGDEALMARVRAIVAQHYTGP